MGAPQELKATLNLPKTDFSMKANLPQNEPKMLARWQEMRIYDLIRESRKGAPVYVLHDGPPYANGPIHLGTGFNKTLKDFVVKTKTMDGFDAPYVPGWDCHGLPIEIKVDDALGRKKLEMQPIQVRNECRKYAEKYLDLQREQFKRLGVFGDWDHPYSTMSPHYESVVAQTLFSFLEKGAVYKGLKPVYWCIHDKTALAEAEVEYENHTSPSIWVRYPMTSDPAKVDPALAGKKLSTIIWTTTPWTLPASMAVAFHPDLEYVALQKDGDVYLVADALAEQTKATTGLGDSQVIARFPGRKLEFTTFAHPFLERSILGVLADYVTTDQGTGAVHTAPSHGADDFYTGVKYKIDPTCNVDEAGRIHKGLPEYDNLRVFDANPKIVELLKDLGVLMGCGQLEHSYPHCWRCHKPVIYRATEQWFISMEADIGGGSLRQRALEEIRKIKWDPAWGDDRISNMVSTRPDWCISRQRVWGVPIAVFFCEGCGELLNGAAIHKVVVDLFAAKGADAWYTTEARDIVPAGTKCAKCGTTSFRKEMDIIDVWFESGSSSMAALPVEQWPSDLYLEGGDQHRGWFQSSLLCAIGARGKAPYRMCVTPGWTLDAQGRAMSKSLGNVVDPVDIAKRLGAEIVRLWVASVDFREDVRASEELMQRIAEQYRKVRNTFRFALQNVFDFDPAKDAVAFTDMLPLDRYMLLRAAEMAETVQKHYREFSFHRAYYTMLDFCVVNLSAMYFDVLKDRLYTAAPRSQKRRSAQTAVWHIAEALTRLIAPLMSFTADEVWQFLPKVDGREKSVHLARFPQARGIAGEISPANSAKFLSEFETLLAVREEALKALEVERKAKTIGSALEAAVTIAAPDSLFPVLEKYQDALRELLIVSAVELAHGSADGVASVQVRISRASGEKCERCWNYSVHLGENRKYPTVCERCSAALAEIEPGV